MAPDEEVQYEVPEKWSRCVVSFEGVEGDASIIRKVAASSLRGIGGTVLVDAGDDSGRVVLARKHKETLERRLELTLRLLREQHRVAISFEPFRNL